MNQETPLPEQKPPHEDAQWILGLHNRTWEMELLVSGFVILLLVRVPDFLRTNLETLPHHIDLKDGTFLLEIGLYFLMFCAFFLTATLIIHLVLRGYWIGVIGLHSVFPNGPAKNNFSKPFSQFLNGRLRDLEPLGLRLDKICSVIFSFSFLVAFAFFSCVVYLAELVGLALLVDPVEDAVGESGAVAMAFLLIIFILCGMAFFFDFFSLGLLKKIPFKFIAVPAYWGYRLFRILTLTFLYENIYYTLTLNAAKKRYGILIVLLIISTTSVWQVDLRPFKFFPYPKTPESRYLVAANHYENLRNPSAFAEEPLIQADVIQEPYLKLFIPFTKNLGNQIRKKCPDLEKSIEFSVSDWKQFTEKMDAPQEKLDIYHNNVQICFNDVVKLHLDGTPLEDLAYYFHIYPSNGERGILCYLPLGELAPGPHYIQVNKNDSIFPVVIPFQYLP